MLKFISVTLMSQLRNGGSRTHTQIHSHARSNTMLLLVAVFGSHFKLSWMELPNIPLGTGPSNCQQLVTSLVLSLYHFVFHEFWPLPLIFFKKINLFIYLFMAALGLRGCAQAFSSRGERRLLFVAVASLVVEHGLQARGLQ